ncbi:RNA-directed DNA polymerase, eukaryota, reverse transcriptase zinc-binding domain protein [Tanacetum coccineum]|uniref:RNA-directed DNA polymerase, eukaryota, reverse transcriptase zinc-binding domain protein n=1 Tax=Tanacetum coccineum TaxID=301880 RepID=A0ABQ5HNM9_9ASTR
MMQMGFGAKWCSWIKGCLSYATVSILVNGSPSNEFKVVRGLRQGDPLSPFLFLIVAEALQVSIIEACNKNLFKDASGLRVNLAKSKLYEIGVNSEEVNRAAIILNYGYDSLPFIYLGGFQNIKKASDDETTLFWEDSWVAPGPCLKLRFPRLYALETNKEVKRNRYVHAPEDQKPNILAEDIFSQVQQYSLLWIANRSSMATNEWEAWISNPSRYDELDFAAEPRIAQLVPALVELFPEFAATCQAQMLFFGFLVWR